MTRANPGDELGRRRHLVAQIGQLEVRVRVDQAGQDRHLARDRLLARPIGRAVPTPRSRPVHRDPRRSRIGGRPSRQN